MSPVFGEGLYVKTKDVLFVHGMYMNGESWKPWVELASARGLTPHAPSWPFHEGSPPSRRSSIDPKLGSLNFKAITDFFKKYIDSLGERPMLIGHSIGGLVVQKLINDEYGQAAVSISPAPPQGVMTLDPHFFRANFPHINPFAGNKPVVMKNKRFHYTFCNTMSREDTNAAFEKYVVPESRNVPRSTLTSQARIDFKRPHAPLLLIAGDSDHLIPLSLVKRNFRKYKPSGSNVDFRQFSGRSHFICNQDGWEEVAKTSFDWLESL